MIQQRKWKTWTALAIAAAVLLLFTGIVVRYMKDQIHTPDSRTARGSHSVNAAKITFEDNGGVNVNYA